MKREGANAGAGTGACPLSGIVSVIRYPGINLSPREGEGYPGPKQKRSSRLDRAASCVDWRWHWGHLDKPLLLALLGGLVDTQTCQLPTYLPLCYLPLVLCYLRASSYHYGCGGVWKGMVGFM